YRDALAALKEHFGPGDAEVVQLHNAYARSLVSHSRAPEAGPPLRHALRASGDGHKLPSWLFCALRIHPPHARTAEGTRAEAVKFLRAAIAELKKPKRTLHDLRLARWLLAGLLAETGRPAEAASLLEDILKQPGTPEQRASDLYALAAVRASAGDAAGC